MEWNRKDCGEFIKSRKYCLRNHKSNAGYDLWKHLRQTRNSFKGSRQERLVLCLSTSSDLSSWRVPLSDPKCCWSLTLSTMSTGWRCWRVPKQGQFFVAATGRKPAPIIITISANCGDGSVTVSFDMLHIVSLTPNCCSRPCQGQIPPNSLGLMLCVGACETGNE